MPSIRLFLFCPDGTIQTLWLPQNLDGRYKFEPVEGIGELPFYVEPAGNRWVMFGGENAEFYTPQDYSFGNNSTRHSLTIEDRVFGRLMYNGSLYATYAEHETAGDHILIPYHFAKTDSYYTIGRNATNTIEYSRREVSREHASLHWDGTCWEIRDLNSTNGIYVNGRCVKSKKLKLGDEVFIMGLRIVAGVNYFALNNANNRIRINTPHIRTLMSLSSVHSLCAPAMHSVEDRAFDRPPRKLIKIAPDPIEIEMPPMKLHGNRIPLYLRLGTPLVMGAQSIIMGNYLSAVTSMVLPSVTQGMTEKDRRDYEARRKEKYSEYLEKKRAEIERERKREERLLERAHPNVSNTLSFVMTKDRLWERRKVDEDFLSVRIGNGELPMIAERKYGKKRFDLEDDELVDRMYHIAEQPVTLPNAPVLLSFREDYVVGVTGGHAAIAALITRMIYQLVCTHSCDELKICVLATGEYKKELEFVRYLRHNWDDERSIRFFASAPQDTQQISNYLKRKEEDYFSKNHYGKVKFSAKAPVIIVFALDKALYENVEFFKNVLENQEYHGISLVTSFDGLPKECSKIIQAEGYFHRIIDLKHPENKEIQFDLDACDPRFANQCMKELFKTRLKAGEAIGSFPSVISFLEMFHVGKVEFLNPLTRWKENNPIKSLAAQIGVYSDGSPFTLDLHEKRQGPHGLIAGMTGSGKSEFIITYILSMAVNYSPEEVAFILIDYKGGGLTDAFEDKARGIHLPHLVGTITNLDGAAINRSLQSINSELKRRQAEFKKAKSETNFGTMDIYDYQKLYRSKVVKTPMPHLFIISDEFAELKKQQPEFMAELISTARIGRSLGVHLILATQKPGGVVNDQIWSNTKFRVCLKVQDRSDSMEMLKRPEAADLKHTGRFYLQVGYNEYFALGQSAWCGASYSPQEEAVVEKDESVEFVDTTGQTILKAAPKNETKSDCKQVVAIVKYLSDLAVREGIQAESLWLEPLPKKIELNDILTENMKTPADTITSVIGIVDDPEKQRQYPLTLDMQSFHHMLICGESGSGKSTFLRTMLYSLLAKYTPEELNYYILDLSAGALNAFRYLPHCGAYVTEENETDFERMLSLIKDMVTERRNLFAEAEVFGYDAYVKQHKLPLALVILDGWTNINNFRKGQEYSLSINTYMREAANYGIRFIVSINHNNEITSRARLEIDYSIALRAKDKFAYNDILSVRNTPLPPEAPGRGVCVIDGRPLEYHVAVINCEDDDQIQSAKLKKLLAGIAERDKDVQPAKSLPMMDNSLQYDEFCGQFAPYRIPLGFTMERMQPVAVPLQQLNTMAVYFGNPIGIRPVVNNLIDAFRREDADLIIVRRVSDTVFNTKFSKQLQESFDGRCTILNSAPEDMTTLDSMIIDNIKAGKMQLRDEFCKQNDIPATDKGRIKKAAKYIRERSKPLFVFFESLPDLINCEIDEILQKEFSVLFNQLKGYNVYFIGCFYPGDESSTSNAVFRSFMKDDFAMLFGGCFDRQWLTNLPLEFKKMDKVNPNYNRFVMKYQNETYRMIMPCGELISGFSDPDDEPIV